VRRPVLLSIVIGAVLIAAADRAGGQQPAPAAAPSRGGVQTFDQPLPEALSPRNASYDITVTLDPAGKQIKGRETIRWRNISAATTNELQFHLYWNAWRNEDSTWLREDRLRTPARRVDATRCGAPTRPGQAT
jgi:hypothetical protein